MKFRHIFIALTCMVSMLALLVSDPDANLLSQLSFGASTIRPIVAICAVFLYIGVLYIGRRGIMDFADFEKLYEKALESPVGAGLFAIAASIVMLSIAVAMIAAMLNF